MCGICGFSHPHQPVNKELFEGMVDIVDYRGPNDRGSFYEENLALGHRRLAIIDLSRDGHQPFAWGDYVAVYNGEIYNYLELKDELAQKGYSFTTTSDTEVLLAAYDHYGEDCVKHFNGMWSFCVYNRQKKLLFCSRDRFGVKPFYYRLQEGEFSFASEIKQLLHLHKGAPTANRETLLRFLALGEMDCDGQTLFEDIMQLQPGHSLVFDLTSRSLQETQWFDLSLETEGPATYEEACREYERLFKEAVGLRLRADVPVGSCLSGGLDSSAIVGVIHKLLEQEGKSGLQHTVSSCYDEEEFNEQAYIEAVIRDTGAISHKVFPKIDASTDWLDTILWHMDEPLPSSSPYSQWCVFEEAARQNLTVMLDGQGADEQLAGYAQFYQVYFVELLRKGKFAAFRKELQAYKRLRAQYQPVSSFAVAAFCLMTAFLPKGLMRAVNSFIIKRRKPRVFRHPLWKKLLLASPQYTMPPTREYIYDSVNGHMRLLLHLEDRNSMAHSVEARVPFLDPVLAQASYNMPFAYKIKEGMSKAVLRDGLKGYLPPEVYARQNKMGFPAPEAAWVRLNRDWFKKELSDACRLFSFALNEEDVLGGFEDYLKAPQTGEFVYWRIMCAGRWAKLFNVKV